MDSEKTCPFLLCHVGTSRFIVKFQFVAPNKLGVSRLQRNSNIANISVMLSVRITPDFTILGINAFAVF